MSPGERLSLALASIAANKLRAALTMLGIIIGVAAVIALVSIGQGSSRAVQEQLRGLGSNLIVLSAFGEKSFRLEDAAELEERVPSIAAAAPLASLGRRTVRNGAAEHETAVEGVTASYSLVRERETVAGRFLVTADVDERQPVAVIGATAAEQLFPGRSPIGGTIEINGRRFTVVGLLAPKGGSLGQDNDDLVLIPVTLAQRMGAGTEIRQMYVKARDESLAQLAVNHITAVYERKWGRPGGDLPLRVLSQDQLLSALDSTSRTLALMLGAIAGISLLVGGIGIMNIMLVSVTERTREIGILKALGARRRDILFQFLLESVLISLSGGLIGVLLGSGGASLAGRLMALPILPSVAAVIGSFGFAAGVGLFFGVYPALKAARLDPIEALRYQ